MKDTIKLEELSREDLVTVVKQLQLKSANLEEERQVVGESLIKAQKFGEVIQEKAQKQAEEILAEAERKKEEVLGGLEAKKDSLKKDIERLLQLKSKVALELERTVEKYQIIVTKEKEDAASSEEENRRLLEDSAESVVLPVVSPIEEVSVPDVPVIEETETVLLDSLPTPVPPVENTSSHELDLTEMLVEPEPVLKENEISLESLIASPTPSPVIEEESEESDIKEFMSGLKQESVVETPLMPATPEVSLEDLLADSSVEETPKATVSPALEGLLTPPVTTPPAEETDLSKILGLGSESSSSLDGQLVDVGDLLK